MPRWKATHEIRLRRSFDGHETTVRVMRLPDGGAPTEVEHEAGSEPIWTWSRPDGWLWAASPQPLRR